MKITVPFKDGYVEITDDSITAKGEEASNFLVDVCDRYRSTDCLRDCVIDCLKIDKLINDGEI